jgi:hypothetical protein
MEVCLEHVEGLLERRGGVERRKEDEWLSSEKEIT